MEILKSETYDPTLIELGGQPHFQKLTILSGATLAAGTVLAESATATKYEAADALADVEPFVLKDAVDASAGDVEAIVYRAGLFDFNKLTVPSGVTLKQLQTAWKGAAMHTVSAVAA